MSVSIFSFFLTITEVLPLIDLSKYLTFLNKSLKAGFNSSGTQLTKIGQSSRNFLNKTLFLIEVGTLYL